ncbi:MAG: hypothetical protein J2P25_23265 [Nocardiopsaceae bacterium]|nr:hypothetical protein [Nocardiopsaceae bacterium]
MPGAALWIMCTVIVVSLAAWLAAVALAQRHPWVEKPGIERRRGRVQGGTHTGGGRSLAPHRDAAAVPGENPEGSTVPDRPGWSGEGSGNPMDL